MDGDIRTRQAPLRQQYTEHPESAPRTLTVRSEGHDLADPLHSRVTPESTPGFAYHTGAHPAVGGHGVSPCSADLLLASLAACQEITVRMVAANLGIRLQHLEVTVEGDWDPRGTLAMGRDFPVGLTAIRARTRVVVDEDERGERAERLLRSAERYCVVLDTLRRGVPVDATLTLEAAPADAS